MTDPEATAREIVEVHIEYRTTTAVQLIDAITAALRTHGDVVRAETVEECAKVADEKAASINKMADPLDLEPSVAAWRAVIEVGDVIRALHDPSSGGDKG